MTDDESSSIFLSDAITDGENWAEKQNATSGRMPVDAAVPVTGGYVAENRDATNAFRAGENGLFDLHDGRRILRLCMAAYKAAEEGREVNLRDADLSEYTRRRPRGSERATGGGDGYSTRLSVRPSSALRRAVSIIRWTSRQNAGLLGPSESTSSSRQ